ncbi:hypothetical protein [Salmonella phage SSBI34]|nr:hypothetical protein [Salmonella phage SSBI34]
MRIKVTEWPEGSKFSPYSFYEVYNFFSGLNKAFVFDDNSEPYFLWELEWSENEG